MSSYQYPFIFIIILSSFMYKDSRASSWEDWWTYEGFSGADYWGLINPEWTFCSRGKYQSPVDIDLTQLMYDPLSPIKYDSKDMNVILENDGHYVKLLPENFTATESPQIWAGPLLYRYTFFQMLLHYGSNDDIGSEHRINGQSFPAELQLYFYNADLYANHSQAINSILGASVISILLKFYPTLNVKSLNYLKLVGQISNETSIDFQNIYDKIESLEFKGSKISKVNFNINKLISNLDEYITYQGSITYPHCQESVIWLISNKPLYLSETMIKSLRKLKRSLEGEPKILLENNFRSPLPTNGRRFMTNIKYKTDDGCMPTSMTTTYKLNP